MVLWYILDLYVPEAITDILFVVGIIGFVRYYVNKIDKLEEKLNKFDFESIDENDWYYHQIINALDIHVQELQWKVTDLEEEIKKLKGDQKKSKPNKK